MRTLTRESARRRWMTTNPLTSAPPLPASIVGSGREYSAGREYSRRGACGCVRRTNSEDTFCVLTSIPAYSNTRLPHARSALGVIVPAGAQPSAKPASRAYENPAARAHRVEAL